jgi:hypothetical protein
VNRSAAYAFFLALLLIDLTFVELHRLFLQSLVDARFSITSEQSYPEYYEHGKELLLVGLTSALAVTRRDRIYVCWTGLFAYLLWDDAFEIHERLGTEISSRIAAGELLGVPAQAVGEMVTPAAAAVLFTVALATAWRRGTHAARRLSIRLMSAVAALAFFGVLIDVVHSVVRTNPWNYRLGIIEESGEMIMVTTIAGLVAVHLAQAASGRFGIAEPDG